MLQILLQGNTALMVAAAKGHTDVILHLLRYGANMDAVNNEASLCILRLTTSVMLLYYLNSG